MFNAPYKLSNKFLSIFVIFTLVLAQLGFAFEASANAFNVQITQDDAINAQEISSFNIEGVADPFDAVFALVYDDNTTIGPVELKDQNGNTLYTFAQRTFNDFLIQTQALLQNPTAYSIQLGSWTISGTPSTTLLFSKDSQGVYHVLVKDLLASDGSSSKNVNLLISSNHFWGIGDSSNNQVLAGTWSTGPQGLLDGTSKFLGSVLTDSTNGYSFTFTSQDFTSLQDGTYNLLLIAASQNAFEALVKNFIIDTTAPSNIDISSSNFNEDKFGATVGTISSDDSSADYSLCGSYADEAYFEVLGNVLKLKDTQSIDYENPIDDNQDNKYEVCIRASDRYGNEAHKVFSLSPNNVDLKVDSAKTIDSNSNGYIDAIELQFNLPIDGRTINSSDFNIQGYTIASISKLSDDTYRIILNEGAQYDTGITPQLSIIGSIKAKSPAQSELIDGTQAPLSVNVSDGAAPYLQELQQIGITNDSDPDYSFEISENATITYQNCYSSLSNATLGTNTIELFASQNSPFQDGTYNNCQIIATDAHANSSSLNVTQFTIDTTAPTVTLSYSSNPAKEGQLIITAQYSEDITSAPLISIDQQGQLDIVQAQMTGQVPGSVFTYEYTVHKDDGQNYRDGLAVVSLSPTQDRAGNSSASPTNNTFIIDTTAPQAPQTPDLVDQSDSGISNTDDITNLSNVEILVLNACQESKDKALLFVNGQETKRFSCISAPSSVRFSQVALQEGQNQIYAKTEDEAGNLSDASGVLTVTLDTQAPSVPTIDKFYDDTGIPGISDNDNHTNDNSIIFEGSFDAQDTYELTIYKYDDAASVWDAQNVNINLNSQTGKWISDTLQNAMSLSGKWYRFKVEAKDKAGNTSSSQEFRIFYDTQAPSAPVLSHRTIYQNYNNATVEFTVAGEPGAYTYVFDAANNNVICFGGLDTSGKFTCTYRFAAEGTYSIYAEQVDKAGNSSIKSQTDTVQVDNTAPTFTINDGVDPTPNKEDVINVSVSDSSTISSGVDNNSLEYAIVNNNSCSATDFANASTKGTFQSGQDFKIAGDFAGKYLCIKASDNVGNTSYKMLGVLHTDNTQPVAVSVSARTVGDSTSALGDIIKIEFSDIHEVLPKDNTWSDNELQIYRINGSNIEQIDLQNATFTSSFDAASEKTELIITLDETNSNYLKNTDYLRVDFVQNAIVDEAGNELSTQTLQSTKTVLNDAFSNDDTVAPDAAASSSKSVAKYGDTVKLEFEFNELLDVGYVPTISIIAQGVNLVNNAQMTKKDQNGLLWFYDFNVSTTTSAKLDISVSAEDRAGNLANISFSNLLILDNDAPMVTIDQNRTSPNAQKAQPEFSGTVQDNYLQNGVLVSVYTNSKLICEDLVANSSWSCISKDVLSEGEHTIEIHARDKAGNQTQKTAKITVASLVLDKSNVSVQEGSTAQFAVKLNSKPQSAVTVKLNVDNPNKASLSKTELTFNSNDWNTYQYITVSAKDDKDTVNDNVIIKVSVDDTRSDQEFHHVSDKYLTVAIKDDDKGGTIFTSRGGGGVIYALNPADFNKDGKIDILDFNYMIIHWGNNNPGAADLDSDGDVDIFDFNLLMIEMNK